MPPTDQHVEALIQLFSTKQYHVLEAELHAWLQQYPTWLIGWKILSDTYMVQKKDAREAAYHALQLNLNDPQEHCYYGLALKAQNDLHAAALAFEQALQLKPDYLAAINNLGIVRKDLGDIAQGMACFERALQLNPAYASCFSNLLFCLSHDDQVDAETLWFKHHQFAELYETPVKSRWKKHLNLRAPGRVLKVGFVSADFREHSLAQFLEPLLPYLAQSTTLNIYAYAASAIEDDTTIRLKRYFQQWYLVDQLKDLDLANLIQQHQIDILIDLDGHTAGNRLTMFALKPAPIQLSWLGYLATTGLTAMDYYLGDAYLLPPGMLDKQFSEKLVQLPVNAPFLPPTLAPEINPLPAIKNGYITFACFNRLNKVNQRTVRLWSAVLENIPTSKLLLIGDPDSTNHTILLDWFKAHGIDAQRLMFTPKVPIYDYLALHHQVDICLDTMPANGVTTTCYAAWMGVPTLCIAGDRMISRGAQAIMQHLGLGDFVVADDHTYIARALHLSENLMHLNQTRQTMRTRFDAALLNQPGKMVDALSLAFRTMWKRWCSGKQPKAFNINS